MLIQLGTLLGLLTVCSIGPGFFFMCRMHWKPAETFCASVAFSFVLIYGISILIYALSLPPAAFWIASAACLMLTVFRIPDLVRLFRNRRLRRQCACFGFLALWASLLACLVRNYSGGDWLWDWLEHYNRVRVFVDHLPNDSPALYYPMPARPPLMNLLGGFFLAQCGIRFEWFQVVCLFLGLLVVFPLCLLGPMLGWRGRTGMVILTVLLLASPTFQENLTWTWTKLFTAFYVLLSLYFYLTGWRGASQSRLAWSFFFMSAGFLVHYSAGVYGLALGLHYLFVVWPHRQRRWQEALAIGTSSAALLATWFAWSIAEFGLAKTFGSNTTFTSFQAGSSRSILEVTARNVLATFAPHPLVVPERDFNAQFAQVNSLGWWRDYTFLNYQTNFIFALGVIGGPLIVYLLIRQWRRMPKWGCRFWPAFVILSALLGIVVHPMRALYGVAHVSGQPLILLGLAFLAGQIWRLPTAVRALVQAGIVVDFALGIFLHFMLENQAVGFQRVNGILQIQPPGTNLSPLAAQNGAIKFSADIIYLGDHLEGLVTPILTLVVLGFLAALTLLWLAGNRGKGKISGAWQRSHRGPSGPGPRGRGSRPGLR